jgi:hypothetical protein
MPFIPRFKSLGFSGMSYKKEAIRSLGMMFSLDWGDSVSPLLVGDVNGGLSSKKSKKELPT